MKGRQRRGARPRAQVRRSTTSLNQRPISGRSSLGLGRHITLRQRCFLPTLEALSCFKRRQKRARGAAKKRAGAKKKGSYAPCRLLEGERQPYGTAAALSPALARGAAGQRGGERGSGRETAQRLASICTLAANLYKNGPCTFTPGRFQGSRSLRRSPLFRLCPSPRRVGWACALESSLVRCLWRVSKAATKRGVDWEAPKRLPLLVGFDCVSLSLFLPPPPSLSPPLSPHPQPPQSRKRQQLLLRL